MYFIEDTYAILQARDAGRVEMSDIQYDALKILHDLVEAYDLSDKRPDNDEAIVNDPTWHKIREYAKEVYNVLS